MQLVISAFPGCGKSTVCKNAESLGLRKGHVRYDEREGVVIDLLSGPGVPVFDSDSSIFPKDNFPENYIAHIKEVLEKFPEVVVMVSSHENVRKALAEENIPFTLVYPELELKGEYLERYEKRGSPENFVNMMDHTWNKFLDSSESDPTPNHVVLGEGEFLIDKMYDKIEDVVASAGGDKITLVDGMENMNDAPWSERIPGFSRAVEVIVNATPLETPPPGVEVTAAIVDVNADANNPDIIQPEPTGGIEVGVVSVPEGEAASTLEGGEFEGTQPAVDASTISDSALDVSGNEDLELAELKQSWADGSPVQDRSDLVEAEIDMGNDIAVLEEVLVHCSEPDRGGMESLQDGGLLFLSASADIKERYGVEVEPTLAGFESFLDSLKGAFTAIGEALKGKPNKEKLAKIKKYLSEADDAIKVYGSDKWLNSQKFYNVGKTKMQIPVGFKDVVDVEGISKIVELYLKSLETQFSTQEKIADSRFKAALPIFNKLKKQKPQDEDEDIKKLRADLPIKPDRVPPPKPGELDGLLKVTLEKGELPVLSKDKIKDVVEIINKILKVGVDWDKVLDKHAERGLGYDDFSDSDFFSKYDNEVEVVELENALVWESSLSGMFEIQGSYGRTMLPVCKFLEMWILNSVK